MISHHGVGVIAAIAGAIDFLAIGRARQLRGGSIHAGGNGAVLILSTVNIALRWSDQTRIVPWGLGVSIVTAGLLGITG